MNGQDHIAIALSGGGSRAMAFHLGCLKALRAAGILHRCEVMSCVSGGSVVGAIYVTHEGSFQEFEERVRAVLKSGLVRPAVRTALTTMEGPKAAFSLLIQCIYWLGHLLSAPLSLVARWVKKSVGIPLIPLVEASAPLRFASRTTILEETLDRLLFAGKTLKELGGRKPKFVSLATELRTGAAFYFTPGESGCWRYGKVNPDKIRVATAVAASAAYPLLLPALDMVLEFNRRDASVRSDRVTLTDGGVYDNLGLSPLWPDRDSTISVDIPQATIIIACRAGYGLRFGQPSLWLMSRLVASFYTSLDRSQNAALKRLFELKKAGVLKAIVLPYLGQADDRMVNAPADLVRREEVAGYPTNFSPMSEDWIDRLVKRGEQVTMAVLKEHNPELLAGQE
jgi:NTE family protein